MKTILIVCGTGIVSSAMMNNAVEELLCRNRLKASILRCRYHEMYHYLPGADLVITSLPLREELPVPVVMGTPFLTGQKTAQTEQDILRLLVR